MTDESGTLLDLPAVWNVLRIGRFKIALVTLICALVSSYYAFVHRTPMYQATSVIVLETQFQKISGMTDIVTDLPLGGFSTDPILFSEREVFKSRILMQSVVDNLGLINDPDFKFKRPADQELWTSEVLTQLAINQLLKNVEVKLIPNSFAFEISATLAYPELAQKIANAVADTYIQSQLNSKKQAGENAAAWLSKRVSELQLALEQSERQVQDFSAAIELLTEQDLRAKEIKLKELRARARELELENDQVYAFGNQDGSDPVVVLKSKSSESVQAAGIDLTASNALQRMQSQLGSLNASIATITDELQGQSRDLLQLEQIKREAQATRELYESFLGKLKEVSIQQGIQRPDSRMLSFATLPMMPVSANPFSLILTASVLGLLGGVFMVFLLDGSRRTFQTGQELEKATGQSVIGVVPKFSATKDEFSLLNSPEMPTTTFESIGAIRSKVLKRPSSKQARIIMMASAIEGDYSTLYGWALGHRISDLGRKVLILDCNMRSADMGLDGPSLAGMLAGTVAIETALKNQTATGPDILQAGYAPKVASDLLAGARFGKVIEHIKALYDVIIVLSPPVILFSDAIVIANHCDEYLFCVTAEKTQKSHVLDALNDLDQSQAQLFGLVLANADMDKQQGRSALRAQSRYLA